MIKQPQLRLLGLAVCLGISGGAHAALLGVTQTFPDVTLNNSYLIYDNNGVNSTTGLLRLVSFSSTLNEGTAAGNSTLTQLYTGGLTPADTTPDLMLSIAINRATGAWVSNSTYNKVSIGFGNSVVPNGAGTTPGFKWTGNVTAFGWQENLTSTPNNEYGTHFDAKWTMTGDDYEDMPANMSQFVDNVLTTAMASYSGGIKISNSAGFAFDKNGDGDSLDANEQVAHPRGFQRDWVFGASATTPAVQALLASFTSGLSATTCTSNTATNCKNFVNSAVLADAFVPVPPALWLWAGALATLVPSARRIKTFNIFRSA